MDSLFTKNYLYDNNLSVVIDVYLFPNRDNIKDIESLDMLR